MATVNADLINATNMLLKMDNYITDQIGGLQTKENPEEINLLIKSFIDVIISRHGADIKLSQHNVSVAELNKVIFYDSKNHLLYYNIGKIYENQGKFDEAKSYYRIAILHNPKEITNYIQLGLLYKHNNNHGLCMKLLKLANKIDPENEMVIKMITDGEKEEKVENGGKLEERERRERLEGFVINRLCGNKVSAKERKEIKDYMIDLVQKADKMSNENRRMECAKLLFFAPDNAQLYGIIGSSFYNDNMIDEARSYFKLSIDYDPKFIDAYISISLLYQNINNDVATKILEGATKIDPNSNTALNTLAVYYAEAHRCDLAEKTLLAVVKGKTNSLDLKVKALTNLGVIVSTLGDNYKAMEYFHSTEKQLCQNGQQIMFLPLLNNKLFIMNNLYIDDIERIYNIPKGTGYSFVYQEHLKINAFFANNKRLQSPYIKTNLPLSRKIKVGYVSSDLRNHVISKFMYDILRCHDREKFEIFCFYNFKVEDNISIEIKKLDVRWINISKMTDEAAAHIIFENKIDILFDLNGHTEGNKIGIFSFKPAPIQISYLGYPNTSGLKEMDYHITDSVADHPSSLQKYSEKLLYLDEHVPDHFEKEHCSFINYNPLNFKPGVGFVEMPINKQTSKDCIVLAALNRPSKNNKYMFKLWATILKELKTAKFMVKLKSKSISDKTKKLYIDSLQIDEDRLLIIPFENQNDDYFNLFNKIDILLDTLPYSGTTTTCDALYMGTPVITYYNKNFHAQNVSASIIKNMNNDIISNDLIAYTEEQYVAKTVALANNRGRIVEYNGVLRQIFKNSMEIKKFMVRYERMLTSLI